MNLEHKSRTSVSFLLLFSSKILTLKFELKVKTNLGFCCSTRTKHITEENSYICEVPTISVSSTYYLVLLDTEQSLVPVWYRSQLSCPTSFLHKIGKVKWRPQKGYPLQDYLNNRDIIPLKPITHWKIEPTIIAPCNSLIMCLNLCRQQNISIKFKNKQKPEKKL